MSFKEVSNKSIVSNCRRAIVFIHGLYGSRKTWEGEPERFVDRFKANEMIYNNYKLFIFEYETSILQARFYRRLRAIIDQNYKRKFNVNIRKISDILVGHLKQILEELDVLIFITHSMGGLIGKKAIVELPNHNKIAYFFSLSVPHLGSQLATIPFFPFLLGNPQIENLKLFSEFTTTLSRDFAKINFPITRMLFQAGHNDEVVNENAALPIKDDRINILTDDNHYSIVKPDSKDHPAYAKIVNSLILLATRNTLKDWRLSYVEYNFPEGLNMTLLKAANFLVEKHEKALKEYEIIQEHEKCQLIIQNEGLDEILSTPLNLIGKLKAESMLNALELLGEFHKEGYEKPLYSIKVEGNNYKITSK